MTRLPFLSVSWLCFFWLVPFSHSIFFSWHQKADTPGLYPLSHIVKVYSSDFLKRKTFSVLEAAVKGLLGCVSDLLMGGSHLDNSLPLLCGAEGGDNFSNLVADNPGVNFGQ